jgi:hypothetical protein
MRDLIWTIILIWLAYRIFSAFQSFSTKKEKDTTVSNPANSGTRDEKIKSAAEKSLNTEGEYVDYEELS